MWCELHHFKEAFFTWEYASCPLQTFKRIWIKKEKRPYCIFLLTKGHNTIFTTPYYFKWYFIYSYFRLYLATNLYCYQVCMCVCLRPSTSKASSIWGWKSRVQINDVVLKTLFSSANFLHRYFSMNHQAFPTSRFILFAH